MPPPSVSLVSMPFKDLRHPPIQLGILEACLHRTGIDARSHSLELAFMEHLRAATVDHPDGPLTIDCYQEVANRDFIAHLGDWIFKVPPYAEPGPDDDAYLGYAREVLPEVAITNAVRMKALVPDFLRAAAD